MVTYLIFDKIIQNYSYKYQSFKINLRHGTFSIQFVYVCIWRMIYVVQLQNSIVYSEMERSKK